jgi:hypothetical protein
MRKLRRPLILMLLTVMGLLVFKNVAMSGDHLQHGNCDEFGHIHWTSFHPGEAIDVSTRFASPESEDEASCHSAQSIFSFSVVLASPFDFIPFDFSSKLTFTSGDSEQILDPVLEPHRKPPKPS